MPGVKAPADNGLVPGLLREGRVTANGLRFAYLEGGSGPLVVLLHGWPDTPHTWDHQLCRGWVPRGSAVAARLPAD